MQYSSRHLEELVTELSRLPGIGKKTAQRLAFHLLRVEEAEAIGLARAIEKLRLEVGSCSQCGNVAETEPCYLCADERRDRTLLCVVESPADVVAIERTGAYKGLYHVLRGALSPLEGTGPAQIRANELLERIRSGRIAEVILAMSPTTPGEATAHYLAGLVAESGATATRIARGVPMGSEIELSDSATLARSLEGRKPI